MAFEICPPRKRGYKLIDTGFVRMDGRGHLTPSKEDADELGLFDRVVVLIDAEAKLIGIRAPKPDDLDAITIKFSIDNVKARAKSLLIRNALLAIGIDYIDRCKGIYPAIWKDSILCFAPKEQEVPQDA